MLIWDMILIIGHVELESIILDDLIGILYGNIGLVEEQNLKTLQYN